MGAKVGCDQANFTICITTAARATATAAAASAVSVALLRISTNNNNYIVPFCLPKCLPTFNSDVIAISMRWFCHHLVESCCWRCSTAFICRCSHTNDKIANEISWNSKRERGKIVENENAKLKLKSKFVFINWNMKGTKWKQWNTDLTRRDVWVCVYVWGRVFGVFLE